MNVLAIGVTQNKAGTLAGMDAKAFLYHPGCVGLTCLDYFSQS